MTRQHFKAIAANLNYQRPLDSWPAEEADSRRAQWNFDVLAMAGVCRYFNSQFNKEKFLEACGGLYDFSARRSDTVYSLTGRIAA